MKKLMKKKFSLFGKEFSVLVVAVVVMMALASAALVPYLSETLTGDVAVSSPLIFTGSFDATNNFDVITQDFKLQNTAAVDIPAIVEMSISGASTDFTNAPVGAEFVILEIGMPKAALIASSVITADCSEDGAVEGADEYCYWDASFDNHFTGVISGDYYVQMGDRADPSPIPAGATLEGRMRLQFQPNVAPDTYSFSATAMNPTDSLDLSP